jgi:hypothetical protein
VNEKKTKAEAESAYILTTLCQNDELAALKTVEGQFNLLQSRTQVLLGLITAVVTVTGIAGSRILPSNFVAGAFIMTGLLTTMVAAFIVLLGILTIGWTTERSETDFPQVLAELVRRRDLKTVRYKRSVVLLVLGLCQYCACFMVYFLSHYRVVAE